MRALLFALVIFITGCSTAPTTKEDARSALPQDFQFIQNGKIIQPSNGVIKLKRDVFYIRYLGKKTPSIFASSNPETKEQFKLLRNPVATWPGTGSAAYPSQLFVNSDALEFYEGWSDEFDRAWGKIFTTENKSDFINFSKQFPIAPLLVASGHNYTNFLPQSDGSRLYSISRIGEERFPNVGHAFIYFILFTDDRPSGRDSKPYLLQWTPIVVEFINNG